MPTTRRTKNAVLAPVRDDPMPRKPRSRATSVASSQRSNDDFHHHVVPSTPAALSRLASHNEELTAENEDLRQELERQKSKRWTLRDKHLAEQLAEYNAQHPTVDHLSKPERESRQERTPDDTAEELKTPQKKVSSPPPPPQTSTSVQVATKFGTPEAPATVPRWRQLLSSLGGFSPFPSRRANKEPESSESPLGELPQNRKRPAPAEEKEEETPTKKVKTPESEQQPPPSASRTLETISEQAELRPQDFAAQTPTRPSREMHQPHTDRPTRTTGPTPRRRTIRDVRAAQTTSRTSLPPSGLRRWEAPPKPKEKNADKRLERMQQLNRLMDQKKQMEAEIARLAAEQEADGIDTRKRKRVKVDELAYIPHNLPGDAHGTFRVPEWDSDDEMEVDEAVPVRQNVFSMNADKQPNASPAKAIPPPSEQPPMSVAAPSSLPPKSMFAQPSGPPQQAPVSPRRPAPVSMPKADLFSQAAPKANSFAPVTPKPDLSKPAAPRADIFKPAAPALKFSFPSIGGGSSNDYSDTIQTAAGQKFARGMESWLAVGLTA